MTDSRRLRLTVRGRLTLVYAGLFLVAGLLLLSVTYLLVSRELPEKEAFVLSRTGVAQVEGEARLMPPPGEPNPQSPAEDVRFARAVAKETRNSALNTLLTQGGIALVVVGVAATALGWLVAGRLLQPLHRMTETARRIAQAPAADRGLHERIGLDGPDDELKELADTFDVMLARLDASFDGQRRFIANASHELRTPLTLNRTLLELALEPESVSPEVRQLGTTLLAINDRHGRLIDGLLVLAQSERPVTERSYVDLADLVDHVTSRVERGKVSVETEAGEATTTGNPVLLERLVENLVENGVRHNVPDGGWVHVTSATRPDASIVLTVANTGPVISRYEVAGLFEPFHRLGAERLTGPGAGLGLSIVRAVARAHGGDVRAEPRDGGGLVVTVTLPGVA